MPEPESTTERGMPTGRLPWRRGVRALHRDVGYFVAGLTVVYAISGLAVNHLADWDPNFVDHERHVSLGHSLPTDDKEAARDIALALGIEPSPDLVDRISDDELEVRFGATTVSAAPQTGELLVRKREPRPFLRLANWLHLNRGKKAWTRIADAYAVLLLCLTLSGLVMVPGRKGLLGRGGALLVLGAAVPVLYVVLSGGP
jgi:hypothetical protein